MRETSGLICFNELFWTHNDSGGRPEIYGLDTQKGKIKATVIVSNASNVDWEEIAQDDQYVYVGDFGNNRGVRRDLCIYKIPKTAFPKEGTAKVTAEKLPFTGRNKQIFPQ